MTEACVMVYSQCCVHQQLWSATPMLSSECTAKNANSENMVLWLCTKQHIITLVPTLTNIQWIFSVGSFSSKGFYWALCSCINTCLSGDFLITHFKQSHLTHHPPVSYLIIYRPPGLNNILSTDNPHNPWPRHMPDMAVISTSFPGSCLLM